MAIRKAVLVTFSVRSNMFDSDYERNKFYRGLYGWRQKIKKSYGEYEYYKDGLLDEVPFVKVDKSLFIISCSNMLRIKEYMDAWRRKVEYNIFEVLLTPEQARLLKKNDVTD
ncbi:MAG: hypothetical protein KAI51_02810 [Candidatus Aenigmarchaeota archaeon]|nr:hypothetical protein [Candidatus Aenigmarchaeota archaeon]MCK5062336.1 hypothetical protein [Candidatus Aenigmarchaeota archaeon]MCK5290163.1 hypothetical protein [Candidatus Aenigmarchaeota archaeon]MCK5452343.1 hypothetical protein [Candidatus Aenigmarchaeota archaeon]